MRARMQQSGARMRGAAASARPQALGGFGSGVIDMPFGTLTCNGISGAEANTGRSRQVEAASMGGAPAAHIVRQYLLHSGFGASSGQQGMPLGIAAALIDSCCIVC
jgi:hypothetical protein